MRKLVLPIASAIALAATMAAGAIPPRKPPSLGIAASPTLLYMQGAQRSTIKVQNIAKKATTLTVGTGNYTISSTGRVVVDPKAPPNRTARAWLAVSPKRLRLAAGASTYISVKSHPPVHAETGDHNALVFVTASGGKAQVGVRTRLGVGVLVRMPGTIERKLVVRKVTVNRKAKTRYIRVFVGNAGNINERVPKGQLTVTLKRGSRTLKTLRAPFFELLPKMRAHPVIAYRGRLHGRFKVLVRIRPERGVASGPRAPDLAPVERTFPIRL